MVIATLAGAGAVFAAAGALRALVVVLADVRVLAFTMVAPATVVAICIDTAFGAEAGLTIDAACQPNATLQLPIGTRLRLGDANMRALTDRNADIIAAFLVLAALAIADAFGAVGAIRAVGIAAALRARTDISVYAAGQSAAALELRSGTGLRFGDTEVRTLAERNTLDAAALLVRVTRGDARSLDACFAVTVTVGIPAAFLTGASAVEFAAYLALQAWGLRVAGAAAA